MRISRLILATAAAITGGFLSLSAQPEADVRAAVDSLFKARNYAWDAAVSNGTDLRGAGRPVPRGAGETQIDGFTTAVLQRCAVLFLGEQGVFKPYDEWRHGRDLSEVELRTYSVRAVGGVGSPRRKLLHAWPHEELDHVLRSARNFRKDGNAIVAEVAGTLEEFMNLQRYFREGSLPRDGLGGLGTVVGLVRPSSKAQPLRPGNSAVLIVWLRGTEIEEFKVEFVTAAVFPAGRAPEETPREFRTTYIRKLRDIGRTKVNVEPKAEALLLAGQN